MEIVAGDFIRALHRAFTPTPSYVLDAVRGVGYNERLGSPGPYLGNYEYLYEEIVGAREFRDGSADSISGLEAPDDRTLVVHLTTPVGDLPYRFALPATAPIPSDPADPSAPLGVADGHDDGYGRFLVASGPYMIEGSEELDFSVPADQQTPASGYRPRESITFVRNPSWERSTDDLRGAYADRIELTIAAPYTEGGLEDLGAMLDAGELDVNVLDWDSPPEQVDRYQADPTLRDRVRFYPVDYMNWLVINLAVPPFDDLHVRRAFNLVLDKQAYTDLIASAGGVHVRPYGHVAFDSMTGGLLSGFDPYTTPDFRGDTRAAREEMRLSRYDVDNDGLCDGTVCEVEGISLVRKKCGTSWGEAVCEADRLVQSGLARIGVDVVFRTVGWGEYSAIPEPGSRLPFYGGIGGQRFTAAQWFGLYFSDPQTAYAHGEFYSLVGATPEQLAGWGYQVTTVPSVDDRIDRCQALTGGDQVECWAELDRYLMTEVAPWVPLFVFEQATIVSERIVRFGVDGVFGAPAPDQIALAPGSE